MQLNINSLQIQSAHTGNSAGTGQTDTVSSVRDSAVSGSSASLHSAESSPATSTPRSASISSADTHSAEKNTSEQTRSDYPGGDQQTRSAVDTEQTALETRQIEQLATRDREVRQHEQAHASVGGAHAGAPSYEYKKGPDGRLYAVSGEVSIDTSAVANDPKATLEKAEIVLRAALAVAEPSGADRAVAARATALAEQARAELSTQDASDTDATGNETIAAGERSEENASLENRQAEELTDELLKNQSAAERVEEEQKAARQDEQRESLADDVVRRQDALDELNTNREEHSAAVSQSLEDYNQRLDEVGERFAQVNQRLVEAGVFKKFFPEGLIIDQSV